MKGKAGVSGFLQSKAVMGLVRGLPSACAAALVTALAWLYHLFDAGERQAFRRGFYCFSRDRDRSERIRLYRKAREGLYEHYFEKMLVAAKPRDYLERYLRRRASFVNEESLREAHERGKGVLLVTAHWGAIELLPALLCLRGYPVTVILETSTTLLARALAEHARRYDVELLIASEGTRVLDAALGALRRGRVLVTQCDEVDAWRRRRGRTVRLFDRDLFFDHTIDFIADRTDSAVVGVFCRRLGARRYRFIAEPIALEGKGSEAAIKSLRLWERYVIESPEQWYQWKKWPDMLVPAS